MAKRVLVIDGDDQGHFFLSVAGRTVTIGDSPTHAEIVLRDLQISRIRCEVEVDEDLVAVTDLASQDSLRQELQPGGSLHIGHSHLRLERAAGEGQEGILPAVVDGDFPKLAAEEQAGPAAPPAAATAPPAAGSRLFKRLMVVDGADQGRSFFLPESGSASVGSSKKNADIVLHDLYVSRVHCELEVQGDRVFVSHLEGQEGTMINGQRIAQKQEFNLGEVLRVGNSHLRLETAAAAEGPAKNEAAAGSAEAAGQDEGFEIIEDEPEVEGVEDVLEVEPIEPTIFPDGVEYARLPHAPVDQLTKLEEQVLGHFQIGRLLGRGQSGLVFRAQDQKSKLNLALKVLSPDFPATGAELQNFIQALKVMPHFRHANLVSLYGAGRTGQLCWIAREFVEGESVSRLIRRLQEAGKYDWTRACRVAVHLARVLAYLHGNKVVHGNIVPRNILIRASDKLTKLADLMLAKALEGSKLYKAILQKKLLAELPYLAPEQTQPDGFVDHLADLYAVGAVTYALLTGQPPFAAESPEETITQIREAKVVKPNKIQKGIPITFEAAVLKLLAKRQEERYQSAEDLLAGLEAVAKEHKVEG